MSNNNDKLQEFYDSFFDIKKEHEQYYNNLVKDFGQYTNNDLQQLDNQHLDNLNFRKLILSKNEGERNYFTITSKESFTSLPSKQINYDWGKGLIYTPLNDHSRNFLKKGDVFFCYRQGQFRDLNDALNMRGIYAIGIATSDPMELFLNEEKHKKWGLLVSFPIQIPHHLKLRNIQMHPETIDLTPYNGNRNDALQYISEPRHYITLLNMLYSMNDQIGELLKFFFPEISLKKIKLPQDILNKYYDVQEPVKSKIDQKILSIKEFIQVIKNSGLKYEKHLIFRFANALQTKPFVILTGLSGSGKTKLAEAFSLWISESNKQYCMVSVGADWTNREPLLGYPNALETGKYIKPDCGALDLILRADKDPDRPYFLILDEMNISHVERYFADFLSAMESIDRTISLHPDTDEWEECDVPPVIELPKNLFIIGTVNIDETTYMFSPKVLDRANVIEFRVSDDEMESYFEKPKELDMKSLRGAGASMGESFVAKAKTKGLIAKDLETTLMPFFKKLQVTGAEFGYRTASEISRFVAICTNIADGNMSDEEIIDAAIMQKLLPKVHGSRNKIEEILKELGKLCLKDSENDSFQINEDKSDKYPVKYPISYEKLNRMYKRVVSDGFTSFAEA